MQIIASKVYTPGSSSATVTATLSGATAVARVPTVTGFVPAPAVRPFHNIQEYFHDGGGQATNRTLDLGFDGASFKAVLTSAESAYIAAHPTVMPYFCLPHNLISLGISNDGRTSEARLQENYPQSQDSNYVNNIKALVATYGINVPYLFMMPEWDNDPANSGWATNRFTELTGIVNPGRADLPSGLTRQQAYNQWIHFYTANNHGGIIDHHQLGQILSVPFATRGYKVQANCANAGSAFYGYEMGVDMITLQRMNDDISGFIGSVGFLRGAATQYGKAYGWDISNWRTAVGVGAIAYNTSNVLTGGWSEAVCKTHYHLMYMSGADMIMQEAHDYESNGTTSINGRGYTPAGVGIKNFSNYALVRHPQRGTAHVPIAIMKDHISFWELLWGPFGQGRAVWYQQMGANGGENMLYNLWALIYPGYNTWGTSGTAAEPVGSGRWGEQFDVLTEKCSAAVMSASYKVIMLSVDTPMDATLQAKLNTFASAGGIVVINQKQLSGTAHESLTGVHVVGAASSSGAITWNADSSTTTEGAYNYVTVTLGTATVLAHSGVNTPQVTKNVVGSGEVWTVLPDYMSNTANNATLGLATKIIQVLIDRFAVATVSGGNHANIDYAITKQAGTSGAATVVTIANLDQSGTTWTGTVSVPGSGTPVREWIADVTPSFAVSGGNTNISASVPAGDVKVYAVG